MNAQHHPHLLFIGKVCRGRKHILPVLSSRAPKMSARELDVDFTYICICAVDVLFVSKKRIVASLPTASRLSLFFLPWRTSSNKPFLQYRRFTVLNYLCCYNNDMTRSKRNSLVRHVSSRAPPTKTSSHVRIVGYMRVVE